ncbi:hypothetical protein BJX66DRAFT_134836 [Aspergillus keveii]|uniref:Uncharacterized protein n=1 Tax=Aspergillus keveii TaxID=714993 RepID=A0ABR4FJ34_9EURO
MNFSTRMCRAWRIVFNDCPHECRGQSTIRMEQLAKESEQGIRSQARTAHCATSLQRLKALKDYSSICLGATFVFALHLNCQATWEGNCR